MSMSAKSLVKSATMVFARTQLVVLDAYAQLVTPWMIQNETASIQGRVLAMRVSPETAAEELSLETKQRGTVVVQLLERLGEHLAKSVLSRTAHLTMNSALLELLMLMNVHLECAKTESASTRKDPLNAFAT